MTDWTLTVSQHPLITKFLHVLILIFLSPRSRVYRGAITMILGDRGTAIAILSKAHMIEEFVRTKNLNLMDPKRNQNSHGSDSIIAK